MINVQFAMQTLSVF